MLWLPLLIFCITIASGYKKRSIGLTDLPEVVQLTEPLDHTETPSWDYRNNILFYVDVHSGKVVSYCYHTNEVNYITLGSGSIGPVVPTDKKDVMLVGFNRSVVEVTWDGKSKTFTQKTLNEVSDKFPESHFNDGKADKKGRLWWGTMGLTPDIVNQGIFYKISGQNFKNADAIIQPVNVSNGLAWNKDNTKLYYINFPTRKIFEYDFNLEKGELSNEKVAFDLENYPELLGNPDGMTIDVEDNLWVALFGGGLVIKVNPKNGQLLQKIAIPARFITDTMFGGPNLDILFVTTFRFNLTDVERRQQPAAGAVFAIKNLKTKGRPVFLAKYQ